MFIYKFWCERDIGCNDDVFASEKLCRKYVRQALKDCDIEDSLEECERDGLIVFEVMQVIQK